jgi:hypothetical protein
MRKWKIQNSQEIRKKSYFIAKNTKERVDKWWVMESWTAKIFDNIQ